jgi:hypothetical protein
MRTHGFVMPTPAFHDDPGLFERVEDLAVEEFVALPMALARRNRCAAIVLELGAANLPLQMKRPERIDSASRRSD